MDIDNGLEFSQFLVEFLIEIEFLFVKPFVLGKLFVELDDLSTGVVFIVFPEVSFFETQLYVLVLFEEELMVIFKIFYLFFVFVRFLVVDDF